MDFENVDAVNPNSNPDEESLGADDKSLTAKDLDAAFDSVVLAEDQFNKQGYEAGKLVARRKDVLEGFLLGGGKGFEIGSEVGIYRGFAKTWIQVLEGKKKTAKETRGLKFLRKILNSALPLENPKEEDEDPWVQVREMRAKFTQCKILLGYEENATPEEKNKTIDW